MQNKGYIQEKTKRNLYPSLITRNLSRGLAQNVFFMFHHLNTNLVTKKHSYSRNLSFNTHVHV